MYWEKEKEKEREQEKERERKRKRKRKRKRDRERGQRERNRERGRERTEREEQRERERNREGVQRERNREREGGTERERGTDREEEKEKREKRKKRLLLEKAYLSSPEKRLQLWTLRTNLLKWTGPSHGAVPWKCVEKPFFNKGLISGLFLLGKGWDVELCNCSCKRFFSFFAWLQHQFWKKCCNCEPWEQTY